MQYHEACLLATAANCTQWPNSSLPELLFAGRSNAGKSSLINALCNRKNLAYSGKTPGKTTLLNFFEVDHKVIFCDAPGYGFSKGRDAQALDFDNLLKPYFEERKNLKGMVLVLDIRRTPSEDDALMVEYAKAMHLPILAACVKSDKVSYGKSLSLLDSVSKAIGIPRSNLIPVSNVTKSGMENLWKAIDSLIS